MSTALVVVALGSVAAGGLLLAVRARARRLAGAVAALREDVDAGLARLRGLRRTRSRRGPRQPAPAP